MPTQRTLEFEPRPTREEIGVLLNFGAELERVMATAEETWPDGDINRINMSPGLGRANTAELRQIFRALVLLELVLPNWSGGSAASAIEVYRLLEKRGADKSRALFNWARRVTRNEYVPSGWRSDARSYDEWLAEQNERNRGYADHVRRQAEEEERAAERRALRTTAHAERVTVSHARYEDLLDRVGKIMSLDPADRLRKIPASDIALEVFPVEAAQVFDHEISQLSHEDRLRLAVAIGRRKRGPWFRLRNRLGITDAEVATAKIDSKPIDAHPNPQPGLAPSSGPRDTRHAASIHLSAEDAEEIIKPLAVAYSRRAEWNKASGTWGRILNGNIEKTIVAYTEQYIRENGTLPSGCHCVRLTAWAGGGTREVNFPL